MFKKPFSFEGRIRRTEYGISFLIYFVFALTVQLVGPINNASDQTGSTLLLLLFIPILWFMLAQGAKRCHDLGNSGWFQLIPFYSLWMLFAESKVGQNKYGPNPKGIGNIDEIDEIGKHLS